MKIKQQRAFTLIELMVVVAIIAILASMGVANFSTAITKARNSVRMNDVMAISKSMEVCYNIANAVYWPVPGQNPPIPKDGAWSSTIAGAEPESPFQAGQGDDENKCLNEDLIPAMKDFNYGIRTNTPPTGSAQKFVACAQLEYVGGWETLGNVKGRISDAGAGDVPTFEDLTTGVVEECTTDNTEPCMFCVPSSQ